MKTLYVHGIIQARGMEHLAAPSAAEYPLEWVNDNNVFWAEDYFTKPRLAHISRQSWEFDAPSVFIDNEITPFRVANYGKFAQTTDLHPLIGWARNYPDECIAWLGQTKDPFVALTRSVEAALQNPHFMLFMCRPALDKLYFQNAEQLARRIIWGYVPNEIKQDSWLHALTSGTFEKNPALYKLDQPVSYAKYEDSYYVDSAARAALSFIRSRTTYDPTQRGSNG